MPTIKQELKRYGELRHETHDSSWMADHNSTQRIPYSRWDRYRRTGFGRRSFQRGGPHCIRDPPITMGSKSKLIFCNSSFFFDQFISNNYPQVQPLVRWRVPVTTIPMPAPSVLWTTASATSAPASESAAATTASMSTVYTETITRLGSCTETYGKSYGNH